MLASVRTFRELTRAGFTGKVGGQVVAWSSELLFMPFDRGQDGRHVDLIWPLWNLFDLTPEGRGTAWHPRLQYE
jgi:predicted dithiol-disulfide oxidoreductase (DUF899 family)